MDETRNKSPESSSEFIFPPRKDEETPQDYWTRVMKENLDRGVSHQVVAGKFGTIMGNKEEREGTDDLTGLKTKKIFWKDLEETLGHLRRQNYEGTPQRASLVLIDLDGFKKENDTKGYLWGDNILKRVAAVLQKDRRTEDIAFRYGGEEFCLVLAGCSLKEATEISEELRGAIVKLGITASFGVVESIDGQESPEELFNKANVACALAKGNLKHPTVTGTPKNRVVLWQTDMPPKLRKSNG